MSGGWLQHAILRAASVLAPGALRRAWLEEWRSELWYVPRAEATRFCVGAFRDALWLRRDERTPEWHIRTHLESPLGCLSFLAVLGAVCLLLAVRLPAPRVMAAAPHLGPRDLPDCFLGTLWISCLLLPVLRLAMGPSAGDSRPLPWRCRLRLGIFLAQKVALVQPILLCGWVVVALTGSVPIAPLAVLACWGLTCRWVLTDQRRRCPVCLRLLTNPVRIGDPAHTFLEWYGAESMCSRGHGLLQVPETSGSYCGRERWLGLDGSWKGLFSEAAEKR